MKELEERARQLLEIARAGHNPRPADATRVRAALKARVLAEPALLQVTSKPAPGASLLHKLAIAFGAGGGAGFAAGLYVAQTMAHPVPEAPAVVAPLAALREETASPAPATHEPDPRDAPSDEPSAPATTGESRRKPVEAVNAPSRPAKAAAVNGPNPLKAELDGLRRAQELLHQGQPAWAVARLNELDRAQVGSILLEERTATRAIAECRLGHEPMAQVQAFEQRFPRSAHLEQVRASCSEAPQGGTQAAILAPRQTENAASHHE